MYNASRPCLEQWPGAKISQAIHDTHGVMGLTPGERISALVETLAIPESNTMQVGAH